MLIQILFLKLFLQTGIGTTFSSVDKYNPNPHLACATNKVLKDTDLVIAHRELPCFTKVIVCNVRTEKCTSAIVKDRGTFGITGDHYTAVVDMSLEVAKRIESNGFEPIILFSPVPIPNKPPKKKAYVRKLS